MAEADAPTADAPPAAVAGSPPATLETADRPQSDQSVLTGLELFAGLPDDVRRLVVQAFESMDFAFGDVLVREGDPADSYWVLRAGRARVLREGADGNEVTLGVLEAGSAFGEGALLRGGVRTSTVRAASAGSAWRLDASVLRALADTQPTVAQNLAAMRRRHEVSDLLRLASPLARVAGSALPELVDRLAGVDLAAGARMTVGGAGGVPGNGRGVAALYLVEAGRLVVYVGGVGGAGGTSGDGAPSAGDGIRGGGARPRYLRRGDLVGEAAILGTAGAPEVLEAIEDAQLLRLDKDDLDAVVAAHPELREALHELADVYAQRQPGHVPLDFAVGADHRLQTGDVRSRARGAHGGPTTDEAREVEARAAFRGVEVEEGATDVGAGGQAGARPRRRRRPPVVRQIDEMDCGAAALAMVCRYHTKRVPLSKLRALVGTGVDGTSAAGIIRAARALGFDARARKASKSALERQALPLIAHWRGDHWVVVNRIGAAAVAFDDPALGHRTLPLEEFRQGWSGFVIELRPGPDFEPGGARFAGMDWVRDLVRPHVPTIGVVAVLAILLSAVELSLEVVIQVVIDRVVGHHHGVGVGSVLVVLAAVTLVLTVGSLGQRLLLLRTAAALDRDGLELMSERLLSLPLAYFTSRRTGDLQRRIDGLRTARGVVMDIGIVTLTLGAQLLASVALLFYYSVPIGALFLVSVPLYLIVTRATVVRLAPATASLEEEAGRYASRQVEVVKGIETAKALAAEVPLQRSLVAQQSALNARQVGVDRMRATYGALTQGIGFALLAGFLALGISQVIGHTLSIGALVACVTLVALATGPMQELVAIADSVQTARTLADRAQDVMDAEPEQGRDRSDLLPVPSISGQVSLRDVTFTYSEAGSRVLDGISVDIPAGATVAVVGRSGSGKTTFARCVAALVNPTSGAVLYDGVDAALLDHRQLRSHIGLVLQETYLFSETIEANIAFGCELDPVRVREVAQLANAADFIERLPLGYETRIGESGLALSGGQRQRIAIARALYRQPALLVLDEATSALDAESERAIQENLGRMLGDRTAIVIAHRLSTVRHADMILVLDHGRLVEQGTHDELVTRRGLYFLLTAQQLDL